MVNVKKIRRTTHTSLSDWLFLPDLSAIRPFVFDGRYIQSLPEQISSFSYRFLPLHNDQRVLDLMADNDTVHVTKATEHFNNGQWSKLGSVVVADPQIALSVGGTVQ